MTAPPMADGAHGVGRLRHHDQHRGNADGGPGRDSAGRDEKGDVRKPEDEQARGDEGVLVILRLALELQDEAEPGVLDLAMGSRVIKHPPPSARAPIIISVRS